MHEPGVAIQVRDGAYPILVPLLDALTPVIRGMPFASSPYPLAIEARADEDIAVRHEHGRSSRNSERRRRQQAAPARPEEIIPVAEEQLQVGKRVVETGTGVRVRKSASEREEIVDEPLMRDEVIVERIPINERIAGSDCPATRFEGEVMVVPVLEEVLAVEKHTILREEVRITRRRREVRDPQRVVLRTEHVSAERFDNSAESSEEGT